MLQTTTNIAVRERKGRQGSARNNARGLVSWYAHFLATFLYLKIEGRAPAALPYAREVVAEEGQRGCCASQENRKKGRALEMKIDTKNPYHLHRHAVI